MLLSFLEHRVKKILKETLSIDVLLEAKIEYAKELKDEQDHLDRYFGAPEESAKSITGQKGGTPQLGRGAVLEKEVKRVTKDHPGFKSTAFRTRTDFENKSGVIAPAGSKLIPTSSKQKTLNGSTHKEFWVLHPDGKTVKRAFVPLNRVSLTETEDTGKHNDEHSLIRIWNYFLQNREHKQNIIDRFDSEDPQENISKYIFNEVEKSISDPNHPLNISHADENGEFVHGGHGFIFKKDKNGNITRTNNNEYSDGVRQRAEASHSENFRNSALSLTKMLLKDKEKELFANDYGMKGTGAKIAKLNDNAKFFGMRDGTTSGTSKSDTIIYEKLPENSNKKPDQEGIKIQREGEPVIDENPEDVKEGLSVKKGGGSQIESPDAMGFNVLYAYAINGHCDQAIQAIPQNDPQRKQKIARIEETRENAHNIRRALGGFEGPTNTDKGKAELAATQAALKSAKLSNKLTKISVSSTKKTKLLAKQKKLLTKKEKGEDVEDQLNEIAEQLQPRTLQQGFMHRGSAPKRKILANKMLDQMHGLFKNELFKNLPPAKDENGEELGHTDFNSWLWGAGGSGEHKLEGEGRAHKILKHGIWKKNGNHTEAELMSFPEYIESMRDENGELPQPEIGTGKHGTLGIRFRDVKKKKSKEASKSIEPAETSSAPSDISKETVAATRPKLRTVRKTKAANQQIRAGRTHTGQQADNINTNPEHNM